VAAALEVFADGGLDAPLSAVARKAGVGQGSLYRHFPDRVSLALAVFEDNVAELEAMVAGPTCSLDDLLSVITTRTIESIAFVDMVTTATDPRLDAVVARVRATLAAALREAHRTATVRVSVTTDDLMLAVGMVAALAAKTPVADRRGTADRAWSLLRQGMQP
jgi:AcrR family transcriptional regulator